MSQTKEHIRLLLDKFMIGTTSLEEERRLSDYFLHEDVPGEWADYQAMFRYFEEGMTTELTPAAAPPAARKPWAKWLAAACVLLLVGLGLWWARPQEGPKMAAHTEKTPPPPPAERPIEAGRQPVEAAAAVPMTRRQAVGDPQSLPAARRKHRRQPAKATQPALRKVDAEAWQEALDRQLRLQTELALAREDQLKASIEAQGYEVAYDENGAIIYYQQQSENIIPL